MKPYVPRSIRSAGVLRHHGWRLKRYEIREGHDPLRREPFADGVTLALDALPAEAVAAGRAGIGLLILHQGARVLYVVLGWWDRENELPLRVFVRPLDGDEGWRAARGGESVCVWDLEVIWFERTAWVETMLAPRPLEDGDREEAYLARTLEVTVSAAAEKTPPAVTSPAPR